MGLRSSCYLIRPGVYHYNASTLNLRWRPVISCSVLLLLSHFYYHSSVPQIASPCLFPAQTYRGISRQPSPFSSGSILLHSCLSVPQPFSRQSPDRLVGVPVSARLSSMPFSQREFSHRYLAGRYIIEPGRYFTPAPPDPANNPKHWRPGPTH